MKDRLLQPGLRSDAARRRQAVVVAAKSLFASEGIDVPLGRIADAAGVGRATLYRNFTDRNGLLVAILSTELDQFEIDVEAADLTANPLALIDAFVTLSLNNSTLLPHWQAMDFLEAEFAAVRARFLSIVAAALPRALASGLIRNDLEPRDLELIAGMLGAALRGETAEERQALTSRAIELIKSGLRA